MSNQEVSLKINRKAGSLSDAEKEIGQFKIAMGFILAKLQPHERQSVIDELESLGLTKFAKEFDLFANPKLRD